jgi:NADP-dependent 3-hydroxy acid dehydrogenase YdfG
MGGPSQNKEREGVSKVWFVTGSSRGFGRSFVEAALSRGDKVAATARNAGDLDDLASSYGDAVFPHELDVTEKAAVFETVRQAKARFGRLDIIVNNAGNQMIQEIYADRLKTWADWQELSVEAYGSLNQEAGEPRLELLGA